MADRKNEDKKKIHEKNSEAKNVESKSAESKNAESKSAESKNAESKNVESKSVESKNVEAKNAESENAHNNTDNHMEQFVKLAEESGFHYAVWIDSTELEFDASLRRYCEENLCGNYGQNYACPPDCGTTDEMEQRVRKYKKALVLQTITQVEDIMDGQETKSVKKKHNQITREFAAKMEETGGQGLMIMAGPCSLCAKCGIQEGISCRFPDKIASCLSAYCINARKMAESSGLEYWCKDNRVAFFSVYLTEAAEKTSIDGKETKV